MRYKKAVTPWIEFLMLSPVELRALVGDAHWGVKVVFDDPGGNYVAVLEKSDI